MQFPVVPKLLKRLTISLAVLAVLVVSIGFAVEYYLKQSAITYDSIDFDYPSTLTLINLKFDSEDVLVTAQYAHINWRWQSVFNGGLSGELLAADGLFIQLKPGDPNETSTFEFSDIPYIQFDEVKGGNIRYIDKDGPDSMIVELPSLYARNFSLNNGIFTDSISAKDGTFIMSFPDTTAAEDTGSALANMIHINANRLELENARLQINYPDEQYSIDKVNVSLNGLGTDNPIEFKLNNLSVVYQDSIELSSNGNEFQISPIGDINLSQFSFSSPLFDLSVNKAEITADDRYYASINKTHLNSDILRMFVDDLPLAAGTDIVFDGGIGWTNDSIIFDRFEILLDKKTKTILDGFAIYGDSLVKTNIGILNFQSTLFELQRLFDLERIEDQKDVDIASQFRVTGNLAQLKVIGSTDLNKNKMWLNAGYLQKLDGANVQLTLTSTALMPNKIVTIAPENLDITEVIFKVNAALDSSNQLQNLTTEFSCSTLHYNDYKLTDLQVNAGMNEILTNINIKAKEQNFSIYVQTEDDILNADAIRFTGNFSSDVPTIFDPSVTAGNARALFQGNLKSNFSNVLFDIKLDSLLFTSDSLENDYINHIAFKYASDATLRRAINVDMNGANIFDFTGDPKTFEWMSEVELGSSDYPYFEAKLNLNVDSNLFELFVGTPGSIDISNLQVTTTKNTVDVALVSPLIMYDEFRIEGAALSFSTNFKSYQGELAIDSLENPYADVNNLKIKVGSTDNYRIESDMYLVLTDFEESIDFAVQLIDSSETKTLKLKDGRAIKFATQNWNITENEGVIFDKEWNVQEGNFKLNSDSQQISVATINEIIDIDISHLQVEPLFKVLAGDSLVHGLLDIRSEYNVQEETFAWRGELRDLKVDTLSVGNITTSGLVTKAHFESNQKLTNQFAELYVTLKKDKKSPLRYDLVMNNFDLASLNPFSRLWGFSGQVEGMLAGKLQGEVADDITASGFIDFSKVKVQLEEFGMFVAIPDSKIKVEENALLFTDFLLKDIEGKPLTINGSVPLQNNRPIKIQAKTEEFKLLEQDNKSGDYWGNIDISGDIAISGTYDNIAIAGNLNLLNSSNIGYRYQSEIEVNKLQDEIHFVSFSDTSTHEIIKRRVDRETKIDWDLDINVGRTKLYVLLYELSNDYLRLVAEGNLKLKSGQGNTPEIFGKVESRSGSIYYEVPMVSNLDMKINYAAVKFIGDAENPIISFTGTETFRVSTNEVRGKSNNKGALVPVMVIAKVSESSIDKFELKFDLQSDDGEMGSFLDGLPASTREAYAMNLLVFGSMTVGAGEGNSTMQTVVNKLNELSRRNLQSADLAFYVDTENDVNQSSTQAVKSIGYDFSKEFFDDKVNVSVGGEVNLAPSASDGRKQFTPLGSVELGYQLNEEPDIKVSISRKDSYLGPIDGQVDKYSVGISFSKWFKNIFHRPKSKRE